MITVVFLGAAFFCIFFFLLGVVFKGMAAMFKAFLTSIATVIRVAVMAGGCFTVLYIVYFVVETIIAGRLGELIVMLLIGGVCFFILTFLFILVGSIILSFVIQVVEIFIDVISTILEGAANICERAYEYFLSIIVNRLERC